MWKRLHLKYPLFYSEFSRQIFEKAQISSFIKIRPIGAELFYADGQKDGRTDITKLTVAFRNYENAPNKGNIF